ncbi:MAG TPA: PSD1 and planctomycete cytochrome C domain-containing protein [Bryobacteraceae bacterium]|nr:PSD1 and planctomycete cytochrome C domain-containing protein [Bryobacteraceae bacterium]
MRGSSVRRTTYGIAALSLLILGSVALGQKSQAPDAVAVLAKCQQCHGEKLQMSNLSMANRASILKGGDHGPAIVPGNAASSVLYQRITGQVQPAMPMAPLPKLTAEEIAAVKAWIDAGAPMADESKPAPTAAAAKSDDSSRLVYGSYEERKITDADRAWWSFKKPLRSAVPHVAGARWSKSPIDGFVKAKLEEKGLSPARAADRNTLIRRAYLDLVGLLPTPAEVDAFVKDPSPNAYENLVDKLLDSPHYGERWARMWLDVARYSDSTGYEYDYDYADAWRYRDYVIKVFNQDKPYNQFILEQLAGDELDNPTFDSVTATGFVRLGPRVVDRDLENPNYRFDYLDDMVRTTFQSFQALTINCARCHDHKFDPITRKDYYKSLAIFNGFVEYEHPLVSRDEWSKYQKAADEVNGKVKALNQQIAAIEAPYKKKLFQATLAKFPADIQEAFKIPEEKRTPGQKLLVAQVSTVRAVDDDTFGGAPAKIKLSDQDEQARKNLEDQIDVLKKQLPPRPPVAMGIRDGDYRFTPHSPFQPGTGGGIIYEDFGFKGKYLPSPGDKYDPPPMYFAATGLGAFADEMKAPVIEPGFLTVLAKGNHPVADPPKNGTPTSGRRRALAEFIASEDNPLTARVMVNQIWYQHFGQGIVSTPNNFGKMGTEPTNPALLDWLATEFMRQGWSIKQIQRLIMNSETYKMGSAYYQADSAAKDPTDQFLWRFPVKRLEAEIIRDSVLSASDDLNLQAGGRAFFPPVPKSVVSAVPIRGTWDLTKEDPSTWRRSIYASVKRNLKYPMFEVFDQPNASLSCERREVTTVPTQALTLFNNETFLEQAQHLAQRVQREAGSDAAAQVRLLYRIAYSREATDKEVTQALEFLKNRPIPAEQSASRALTPLAEFAHVILNSNEFLYIN